MTFEIVREGQNMAEITRQRQKQAELTMQQQPIQQEKKARQMGMPQPDMIQQQMPAEILAKLQALPVQIPKNMYEGEALTNHEELITDQFRSLNTGTVLVDRKLQFREYTAEQKAQQRA